MENWNFTVSELDSNSFRASRVEPHLTPEAASELFIEFLHGQGREPSQEELEQHMAYGSNAEGVTFCVRAGEEVFNVNRWPSEKIRRAVITDQILRRLIASEAAGSRWSSDGEPATIINASMEGFEMEVDHGEGDFTRLTVLRCHLLEEGSAGMQRNSIMFDCEGSWVIREMIPIKPDPRGDASLSGE